jgi:predicted RND superfamily exporter protein
MSMNFSDVPPFNHLGNMVAIGVIASFLLSVSFLPALMSVLPVRVSLVVNDDSHLMHRVGDFVVAQRHKLIWGMATLVIILIAAVPRNELNDVFVHYFDQTVPFRNDADFMTANLTGLYVIDYSLDSGESGGISNPDFLKEVDAFASWYRQQPETIHVNTFTDVMKRLNKNMHGDEESWYKLPAERNLAAQYLLLYEMSLPYGLDLNNQINVGKSATRFTATLQTMSTNQLLTFDKHATQWLKENAPHVHTGEGSGTTMMFAHIGKRNIISMLTGTTVALIGISLILIFALRSVKIGLISMIPNLVPAAMGFGLWGLLVGEVGLSLSIVAGMTLGIVVDDTVHFLSKYLRARREKGFAAEEAVRYAFRNVGMALFTTSVVLVVGFMVLSLSSFELNSGMGLLTAIVIAFALLADFLLLPPLLMLFDKKHLKQHTTTKEPGHA